jgi:putative N-acetyltransferase (TIGR04045 family)
MAFRFYPGEYRIRPVRAAWELRACAALRRDVFCDEQKLFDDDADTLDQRALHIAAIACVLSQPEQVVGTVRIHEAAAGIWFGSRLAVHSDFRCGHALGHKLIRHAVSTAHAHGAREFFAHVQVQNAPLFQRLHWRALATQEIYGQPHVLMAADLDFYPPAAREEIALYAPSRASRQPALTALEAA